MSALQPDLSHPLTTWGGAFSCSALCTKKKLMKAQGIYTGRSYQGCWECIHLPPLLWKGTSLNRGQLAHLLQKACLLLCSPAMEGTCYVIREESPKTGMQPPLLLKKTKKGNNLTHLYSFISKECDVRASVTTLSLPQLICKGCQVIRLLDFLRLQKKTESPRWALGQ